MGRTTHWEVCRLSAGRLLVLCTGQGALSLHRWRGPHSWRVCRLRVTGYGQSWEPCCRMVGEGLTCMNALSMGKVQPESHRLRRELARRSGHCR